MKKILFCFFAFVLFSCTGYEPIFSSKNLSFNIKNIKNVNGDDITRKIANNLNSNKVKSNSKKNYTLEISSYLNNNITSKNSKGDATTFEMIINVKVLVFNTNSESQIHTLSFNKNFNYNNQVNKFDLSKYKKGIEDNLINKISQDILIKLQSL
ncbi:hypothetical protein N9S20_00700 [Candidatus Pelagibacter sp.]|nr:hypothetical protein [Candidatus Pelagibacter sp.]